jgi:pimeloyl-ACP methyl ester carboxylesterase
VIGASRDICRTYLKHFLTHWSYRKDAFDGVMEEWVDTFMQPGVLQGGFNWYISQNAARLAAIAGNAPKPPKIQVPAGVLWGRHDPILKAEWADVLPDYFESIDVNFAENEGHFVHYENPDLAANAIAKFYANREA